MIDELILAELLNSKYCHDLAGVLGATKNAADFLKSEDLEIKEKAISLIEESSFQAVTKLKLYRKAFGTSLAITKQDYIDMHEILSNYFIQKKITLQWNLKYDQLQNIEIPPVVIKILLNLTIIASDAILKSGTLFVSFSHDSKYYNFTISSNSEHLKFDPELNHIIDGNFDIKNLSSKNIQIYYIYRLINTTNANLKMTQSGTSLTFNLHSLIAGEKNG